MYKHQNDHVEVVSEYLNHVLHTMYTPRSSTSQCAVSQAFESCLMCGFLWRVVVQLSVLNDCPLEPFNVDGQSEHGGDDHDSLCWDQSISSAINDMTDL
jgi:hypothetical protein